MLRFFFAVRSNVNKSQILTVARCPLPNLNRLVKDMHKISFTGLLLLLLTSSTVAQPSILLDYRNEDFNAESSPQLPANTENLVISQMVRNTDQACNGELSPTVIDYARGSFTDAQADQVVYLVSLGDSCHPRFQSTIRIGVAYSGQVVTYGDVTGYSNIQKISDVNGDGINEILLDGSGMGQGYFVTYAKLVEIKPKGLLTLKDFEQVYSDNLGTLNPKLYKIASVISVNQGSQNQTVFSRKNYLARCFDVEPEGRDCSSYQYMSEGNFPEYEEIQQFISDPTKGSNLGLLHKALTLSYQSLEL
ncbi:hypothetical protein MC7420_1191 [Coleofasciculus chthonoplastes PCC 7420]|uniref:Uncharacterized protein n=1 Tax=Coleofasciculus chthonoplastes PCC 7420 TaxID=118168 RepID=B4VXP4_9CYAN|nr:hypothetical protein [Coleofasciculus chthonoplastes]EDX73395.1 hypothetical protein MC7420_1191 [Coleofasciculus chthonoplastes PCC 7420]